MKKWFIIIVACFGFVSFQPSGKAEWAIHFDDMPIENSHYSNVYYLADLGIIRGYPTTYEWIYEFKPSNDVTKRQVATMLVRTLGLEGERTTDPGFVDVTKKDGAYNDIAIAVAKGFFKKGTYFKPGASITREEMAYALVRAFDLTGESGMQFSDISKTHAAYKDVQALAANYITTGSNGKFNPKANLTRAQFASFLTRVILPQARPSGEEITSGFVPEAEGQTYVYRHYHGGGYEELVYDYVRFASYGGFNRSLLLTNSENEYIEMGYFESSHHVQFDVPFDIYSRLLVLEYPLNTGKQFYFNEINEDSNDSIPHKVTVSTTNGMYKINNQIYTNVTIVKDEFLFEDEAQKRVFYIVPEIGIIAGLFSNSTLELERIE
ncbi:MAG: S-layer homology domain-containing protein [Solibacillus sp.]